LQPTNNQRHARMLLDLALLKPQRPSGFVQVGMSSY
jgi:hypothetical protein